MATNSGQPGENERLAELDAAMADIGQRARQSEQVVSDFRSRVGSGLILLRQLSRTAGEHGRQDEKELADFAAHIDDQIDEFISAWLARKEHDLGEWKRLLIGGK